MDSNFQPQFKFAWLYVPPFTKQRGFDEKNLTTVWEPLKFQRNYSKVTMLDAAVDAIIDGCSSAQVARRLGVSSTYLNGMMQLLTGQSLQEFIIDWRARSARVLLLYTDLDVDEVMRRCGYTSFTTFCSFVKKHLGAAPLTYRHGFRKAGDLGKYGL